MDPGEAYDLLVRELPEGRIATLRPSCIELARAISGYEGDHVEIGVLWGGSAIFTALVKPKGKIYAVDPVSANGYYGGPDVTGAQPSGSHVLSNIAHFGLQDRIELVESFSDPWPLPGLVFDTALIDGDHSYAAAIRDFRNLKDVVRHVIAWDNVGDGHYGVWFAFHEAAGDPDWEILGIRERIGVLVRV